MKAPKKPWLSLQGKWAQYYETGRWENLPIKWLEQRAVRQQAFLEEQIPKEKLSWWKRMKDRLQIVYFGPRASKKKGGTEC